MAVENFEQIKKSQEQNAFVKEKKEIFFVVCNKFLDGIYESLESVELQDTEKERLRSVAKDYELIRKKIHNEANLSNKEISLLILSTQYIAADMEREGKDFLDAAKNLNEYIKTLTFQDD